MNIEMPRGDIKNVSFAVNNPDGSESSILFDDIFFTVKKYHTDKNPIFQKRLSDGSIFKRTDGKYGFRIESDDTDNLHIGTYEFDIEVVRNPDIKQTTTGNLVLTKEITWASNEVISNG